MLKGLTGHFGLELRRKVGAIVSRLVGAVVLDKHWSWDVLGSVGGCCVTAASCLILSGVADG